MALQSATPARDSAPQPTFPRTTLGASATGSSATDWHPRRGVFRPEVTAALLDAALDLAFAEPVRAFLDRAQAAGIRHVTYLSARGVEQAPPPVAMRAVELDLAARDGLTHTILRPAFFMHNFTEGAFAEALTTGTLALPAGDGAEAFIDVLDIAAAAAASLQDPATHAGAEHELTGPEALTHTQVAALLSRPHRPVTYQPVSVETWVASASASATAAGLPAGYAAFLATLLAESRKATAPSRPAPSSAPAAAHPHRCASPRPRAQISDNWSRSPRATLVETSLAHR